MEIKIETSSYNEKRYSKPWVARVDFSTNPKGDFKFGDWVGDHSNGSEGLLVINAEVNDVIATGQKDYRNAKYSAPSFYYVTETGELESFDGKADAYKFYLESKETPVKENPLAKFTDEELLAEIERRNLLKK